MTTFVCTSFSTGAVKGRPNTMVYQRDSIIEAAMAFYRDMDDFPEEISTRVGGKVSIERMEDQNNLLRKRIDHLEITLKTKQNTLEKLFHLCKQALAEATPKEAEKDA